MLFIPGTAVRGPEPGSVCLCEDNMIRRTPGMKKILALILCVALLATLPLTGVMAEDLYEITVLCKNDYDSNIKTVNWEKYDSAQYFIAKMAERGVKIVPECIDNSSFATVVNSRMAAGVDLPDVISLAFDSLGSGDVLNWAEAGLVWDLNELLDKYDEDNSIRTFYNERCPGALGANTAPDGGLYWFSYLAGGTNLDPVTGEAIVTVPGPRGLSLREDWLNKVGLEIQFGYTPDELYEALLAMYEGDANGNGLKDEVVNVSIDDFDNGIAGGFGLHTGLIGYGRDNVVSCNITDPNFPEYIKFMQKLVEAGLYDSRALSSTLFSSELITENKAAATYNYSTWGDYENQIANVTDAQYTPIAFGTDWENDINIAGDVAVGTYNCYFITKACKDPEKVMRMFDYFYTEEYARLDVIGLEGVNYEVNENGAVVGIDVAEKFNNGEPIEFGTELHYKTQNFFGTSMGLYGLPAMNVVTRVYTPVEPYGVAIKKQAWVDKLNAEYYDKVYVNNYQYALATEDEKEDWNDMYTEFSTYATELVTNLILGKESLDDLDKHIAELEKLGMSRLVEIRQARRDRYLEACK